MAAPDRNPSNALGERSSPVPGLLIGLVFAVVLLKFGTPTVLDFRTEIPASLLQIIEQTWPLKWGFVMMAIFLFAGQVWALPGKGRGGEPKARRFSWVMWLPLVWFGWQCLSATQTIDRKLTSITLPHFAIAVGCFYFGVFVLGKLTSLRWFWAALTAALGLVLMVGVYQQFVSLEQTRKYVLENEAKQWRDVPTVELEDLLKNGVVIPAPNGGYMAEPEVLKRIKGGRVYATFIYANALAAAILLLLPMACFTVWHLTEGWQELHRLILLGLLLYLGFGCLYWSGSKAGWLVCLGVLGMALLHLPFSRQLKIGLVLGLMVVGGAGFAWKYRSYFAGGGTSVVARFDAWRAAVQIAKDRPLLGSGPATFGKLYQDMKPANAEMARLPHNDYLGQACDSGLAGFLAYSGFVLGSLLLLYRYSSKTLLSLNFAVWLGLLGWATHSIVEFSLYIPATAWITFLLFGWLWAEERKAFDKPTPPG